jgi:hypothetical protein
MRSFLCFVALPVLASEWAILKLDNYTMPMLVGKELSAFVRFDREYPYGDKADAFKAMAAEVAKAGAPLLVGSIGVSTWGDRMNNDVVVAEGLIPADKELGYDDMDSLFPKFRFYPAKGGKAVDFTGEVTQDGLMQFLKDTAKIYFALPGCIKALDEIAMKFKGSKGDVEKAKKAVDELGELEKEKAAYYLKAMEKEIAKPGHIVKEKARLEGMLKSASLVPAKKEDMSKKVNVLASFSEL